MTSSLWWLMLAKLAVKTTLLSQFADLLSLFVILLHTKFWHPVVITATSAKITYSRFALKFSISHLGSPMNYVRVINLKVSVKKTHALSSNSVRIIHYRRGRVRLVYVY